MTVNTTSAVIFRAVLAAAFLSVASVAAADPARELAALQAVDQAWEKAYNAGDFATLASLYAEDAVLLPPGSPPVNGRAAIRAYFARDTAESAKAGSVFRLGARPAGGVSGVMGWQSGTYVALDKAGKLLDSGKYLSVSVKQGGKWLYVRDTWNSDGAPSQTAAPATM
jgi:uncharacterized protein (TIGR02246 family)